ncbi:MAG: hypothetical protein JO334_07535 [Verrucomicrobia bacterium]|nr:hypothetical protein [Verrucomicrobiota bacterium]
MRSNKFPEAHLQDAISNVVMVIVVSYRDDGFLLLLEPGKNFPVKLAPKRWILFSGPFVQEENGFVF